MDRQGLPQNYLQRYISSDVPAEVEMKRGDVNARPFCLCMYDIKWMLAGRFDKTEAVMMWNVSSATVCIFVEHTQWQLLTQHTLVEISYYFTFRVWGLCEN